MHLISILTLDLKLSKEEKEKKKGPTDGRTDRQTDRWIKEQKYVISVFVKVAQKSFL